MKRHFWKKFFDGTAGKGPLQQTKMLSSQFCLLNQLWFDVFGDLSLQTCYTCSSVVYLKCFKAFFCFYWVASMAIPVGKWVGFVCLIFTCGYIHEFW